MQNVAASIILFNPDLVLLKENIDSVYNQVSELIIVDNGSNNIDEIKVALKSYKFILIENMVNYGIAKALNQAFYIAREKGFEYLLTLDQDSISDENMVEKLSILAGEKIGIICPAIRFEYENNSVYYTTSKNRYIIACITSGSLTSVAAWTKVQGFDEWMFIDHVDNDFCMRLRINGYKIVRCNTTFLSQRAGDMLYLKLPFGLKHRLFGYNSLRQYYITRNTVYFIIKYWGKFNVMKKIINLFIFHMDVLLFEKNRITNFKTIIKGYCHGLKTSCRL